MHRYFAFGILLMTFAAGCSKEPAASSTPSDAPAITNESQQVTSPASPSAPSATDKAPDLNALTLSLHHWIMRNQRHPANFDEFAKGADIPIPPAPAGKKYAISKSMSVILVDQ